MKVVAARTLRWLADRVDPPPRRTNAACYTGPVESAFEGSGELETLRRQDALKLMDPDTLGYVMVRCRQITTSFSKLEFTAAMTDGMWPAMRGTLRKIIDEANSIHA